MPKISSTITKVSKANESVYTADKNRVANLFTNQERISHILNPTQVPENGRLRNFPEDKSIQAFLKKYLPNKVKPIFSRTQATTSPPSVRRKDQQPMPQ